MKNLTTFHEIGNVYHEKYKNLLNMKKIIEKSCYLQLRTKLLLRRIHPKKIFNLHKLFNCEK